MSAEVLTAVLACFGTLVGSIAGVLASARLTNFRLQQLEEKVKLHNNLVERMVLAEQSTKAAHHRIDEIMESSREG
ncbi:MAG: hypothetical protein ACYCX2_12160 [Christensenellales bacterium]